MSKMEKTLSSFKASMIKKNNNLGSIESQCFYIYKTLSNAIIDGNDSLILTFCMPILAQEILNRSWYKKHNIHWRILKNIQQPKLISINSGKYNSIGSSCLVVMNFNYEQVLCIRDITNKLLKGSLHHTSIVNSYHIFYYRPHTDGSFYWCYACPYENI